MVLLSSVRPSVSPIVSRPETSKFTECWLTMYYSLYILQSRNSRRAWICTHHSEFQLLNKSDARLTSIIQNEIGGLNGVNSAGAILGCLTSAYTADKYSRKRTIQLGCLILIIGGTLCAGSVTIGMFYVGRVFAGIGAGILAVVVPMYQGEVATAETRGAMMSVTGIMYAFGVRH
jgi:MFS family permease